MKKTLINIFCFGFFILACDDDDNRIFEKTADERAAEAIANLKADLTDPEDGWFVKYRPVDESGSYYAVMKFSDDGKVTITSDVGAEDGKFLQQTVGYRIDNSLGLELIIENYTFFHYLYELDQATFSAEYEFDFVNKTPDNLLVFASKSDLGTPSTIVFTPADNEISQIGQNASTLIEDYNQSINNFTQPSSMIVFSDKDLAVYLTLDKEKRIADFNYISKKTDVGSGVAVDLTTGYHFFRDSIVFETPLNASFDGQSVFIKHLALDELEDASFEFCAGNPISHPIIKGSTSTGEAIEFHPTMINNSGTEFQTYSTIYIADILNIFDAEGNRMNEEIQADISGALFMVIYNEGNSDIGTITGIGFYIENPNNAEETIAVKKYVPTYENNKITFTIEPDITFVRGPDTPADLTRIDKYLNLLTEGNQTYIFEYAAGIYEFYNPCNGYSFVFQSV